MSELNMNKVLILDTETTGIKNHPTHGHPQVIELSTIDFDLHYNLQYLPALIQRENVREHFDIYYKDKIFNQLYKPSMEISPEATAIHGKTLRDLINSPRSETCKLPSNAKYLIGHNIISFDHRCLGKPPGYLLIDTLVICKLIRKYTNHDLKAENNKLDDLINSLYPDLAKQYHNDGLHNALDDCFKVLLLLSAILGFFPTICHWDELYTLQQMGKKK